MPALALMRRILRDAEFFRDLVRGEKPMPKTSSASRRVLPDERRRPPAVLLEYLDRVGRADAVALKKNHDLADLPLGLPGVPDHVDRFSPIPSTSLRRSNACSITRGTLFQRGDEPFGHDRADALDHARTEVALYAGMVAGMNDS